MSSFREASKHHLFASRDIGHGRPWPSRQAAAPPFVVATASSPRRGFVRRPEKRPTIPFRRAACRSVVPPGLDADRRREPGGAEDRGEKIAGKRLCDDACSRAFPATGGPRPGIHAGCPWSNATARGPLTGLLAGAAFSLSRNPQAGSLCHQSSGFGRGEYRPFSRTVCANGFHLGRRINRRSRTSRIFRATSTLLPLKAARTRPAGSMISASVLGP